MKFFFDSNVLIAAARGNRETSEVALHLVNDPRVEIVTSLLVKMEALAPAVRNGKPEQAAFVRDFLSRAVQWVAVDDELCEEAYAESCRIPGLDPVDALLVCAARKADAVFITFELPKNPLHQIRNARIVCAYPRAASKP